MYEFKFIDDGIGEIRIDSFVESFQSDLSYWTSDQYKAQWEKAHKLIALGEPSVFITSITDPASTNFIKGWVCYPIDNENVFQERIFFLDQLNEPFNENNPYKHIGPYESVSEDGDAISEWRVKRNSI